MEFRVLGPLEVLADDGAPLAIGAGKPRALLARLAQAEEGHLRMSELADYAQLSPSRVSRLVDELEEARALADELLAKDPPLSVRRAALHAAPGSEALHQHLARVRGWLRAEIDRVFAPELARRTDGQRTAGALEVLLSFEAWDQLRSYQGHGVADAAARIGALLQVEPPRSRQRQLGHREERTAEDQQADQQQAGRHQLNNLRAAGDPAARSRSASAS